MSSVFALLVVTVLNLVPAEVNEFTMETPGDETIRFTQQAEHRWRAVEQPDDDLGAFHVDGTKLTMNIGGQNRTYDFARFLDVGEDAPWSQLKEIEFGPRTIRIHRKDNGVDFVMAGRGGNKDEPRTFRVLWAQDAGADPRAEGEAGTGKAPGEEEKEGLDRLESEITQSLAGDRWHPASKAFVRALWEDYRKAHLNPKSGHSTRSLHGEMPDVESYDEYVGAFARRASARRPFVEVTRSEGRFFVKLEGHTIPAVPRNKCIFFTTGDVVYSRLPAFGEKPYCTLEMFLIMRSEDTFLFGSPGRPPAKWLELHRVSETE
jgi:hypothetical protein